MVLDQVSERVATSRRERLRTQMRDEILAAARSIVQEQGFKELSMRALGRAVGVTAPTLYDYFSSKDAVLDGLYLEGTQLIHQQFAAAAAAAAPGVERLRAFGHAYRRFALENGDLFMLLFGRIDAAYRPGEAEKATCMSLMDPVIEAVTEAIDLGQMRPVDPEAAGIALWTMVHGFAMLEANKVMESCPSEEMDAMFESNLNFLRDGLRV